MRALWFVVVALVWTTSADANATGNDLKEACDAPDGSDRSIYCLGYLTGVLDMLHTEDALGYGPKLSWCIPPGVTGEQLYAMWKKYLSDHPERLNYAASSLIADMYAENFACNKSP